MAILIPIVWLVLGLALSVAAFKKGFAFGNLAVLRQIGKFFDEVKATPEGKHVKDPLRRLLDLIYAIDDVSWKAVTPFSDRSDKNLVVLKPVADVEYEDDVVPAV